MDDEYYEHEDEREAGASRQPLWLEKVRRRSLGDVRLHDSSQAGELARRLGARAFTVGRDIYAQPELVKPHTPHGAALLAHEMTHVAEQTGVAPEAMPLLSPPPARQSPQATAIQRQAVQRATESETSSETRAEAAEAEALRQTQSAKKRKRPPPDPYAVADLVYDKMTREMMHDRDRGAFA
jgi:uncharacterized protein DUF4157